MIWSVAIREAAQTDIAAAVAWYESEAPEQVIRFSRDFDSTISRITPHPLVPTPFVHEFRRMALRIFPYQVWYVADEESELLQVVAVIHIRIMPLDRRPSSGRSAIAQGLDGRHVRAGNAPTAVLLSLGDDHPFDEGTAMSASFTMYSTPWCGYCHRLKSQLDREGIAYEVVDIEQVPEAAKIVEQVNNGNQTVPTLVYSDGSAQTNPSVAQVKAKLAELG